MTTILDKIVASKWREVESAKARVPQPQLEQAAAEMPAPRDFVAALAGAPPVRLIAEIKKASPSQGIIRKDFRPREIARTYVAHRAQCISVLTDAPFFQGSLAILQQVRMEVDVPLLRKDFILDPYQIIEARAAGADAVLLIVECLDDQQLADLYAATRRFGMTALVECYRQENLQRAIDLGAKLIGVNSRDLHSFEVNLQRTMDMRCQVPADRLVVAESGIRSRQDVLELQASGVDAMLVGQQFMQAEDVGRAVDELTGD